jgi:ribose transport system ATP-binding protein
VEKKVRLRMSNISKSFPGVRALDNVDFTLLEGEVHALVGENGAGKSTLIKILTGLYQKDIGTVCIAGAEVAIQGVQDSRRLGIAAIYQELDAVPIFTVAENIFLGIEPCGCLGKISNKQINIRAQEVLGTLGSGIHPRQLVYELGVGQKQEVMIARALVERANIIVMDEVTASLSELEKDKLFTIIAELKARGISVIYISHRLEEIFEVADRVTVMRDGQVVGTRQTSDVDVDSIIQMMIGRDIEDRFLKSNVRIDEEEEVLRVENLSRGESVRNVSFRLRKGEILGLGGLVGAGRSEVARLICGIDKKDAGRVYRLGKLVDIKSSHDAVKVGIALIPEERRSEGLVLEMSICENVTLASLLKFCWMKTVIRFSLEKARVTELVNTLSIRTPNLKQNARKLSGGNQQKVVLSKWLCSGAKVFIFDEPTKGVDVGAKKEIYKIVGTLVQEGAAVVLISSDLPELLALSDRILVMYRGEIRSELSREEASPAKVIYYATGGERRDGAG